MKIENVLCIQPLNLLSKDHYDFSFCSHSSFPFHCQIKYWRQ